MPRMVPYCGPDGPGHLDLDAELASIRQALAAHTHAGTPVEPPEPEPVTVASITRAMGVGINLSGMESPGRPWSWPNLPEWGEQHVKLVAQYPFKHVRLPVRWNHNWDGDRPRQAFGEDVDRRIGWMLDAGLIVVLNTHHFDELSANPHANLDLFRRIWRHLAERYAHIPNTRLIFELQNEPKDALQRDLGLLHDVQLAGLSEIRRISPDRVVQYGRSMSGVWNPDEVKEIQDPWTQITLHAYETGFDHQTGNSRRWPAGNDQERWRQLYNTFEARWAGKSVHVGEFGCRMNAPSPDRERYLRWQLEQFTKRGWAPCFWDFCSIPWGAWDHAAGMWRPWIREVYPT